MENLTAHKTAAIRIELARQPDLALAALVHALALDVWYGRGGCPGTCLDLHLGSRSVPLGDDPGKAFSELTVLDEGWKQRIPADREELWPWCLAQSRETHFDLLAFLVAQSVDAVRKKADADDAAHLHHADQMAAALRLDMRNWYTPTADGFFCFVNRKIILASIDQATGPHGPALDKLGKRELASRAEQLLAPTGWLPEPLRIRRDEPAPAMAAD
jgi:ParB family chromosome partitioning protein